MKRIIFITILTIFAGSLFAQKTVRKAIRNGNSAYKEQRYSAAETDYAKALEEDASSKQASFNLANTFHKQGRWDEATQEYQHYLTLESESPENMSSAWSNMGNNFLKKKANEKHQAQGAPQQPQQGQQQQAPDNLKMSMEAYKNALRLNPNDNETRENLAIVQKMIKDQEGDGGGGGEDDKQDQKDDKKDDQKQDQQKQDQKDDKKEDKKQDENQMSQDNIQQILEAIEQDERETQQKVNQAKADERNKQSERNRKQDKDW